MRVTVVIPSYNQAHYLRQTLSSVVAQRDTGIDLEVIVIDGGSSDGSVEVIKQFEEQIDHWVSEPDDGQADALAKGFARSTGEIMGWVNSDDLLLPGALSAVVDAFAQDPEADVFYGDAAWIDSDSKIIRIQREVAYDLPMLIWAYNYIPQPSTYWRRSIWDKTPGLDLNYDCAFDFGLWLSFIRAGGTIKHLPGVVSAFRYYAEQKNQRLRQISNAEDRALVDAFLDRRVTVCERTVRRLYHRLRRVSTRTVNGSYRARPLGRGIDIFDAAHRGVICTPDPRRKAA